MGKGEGAIGTVPSADGKLSDLDGGDRGDTTPGGVSGSDVPKAESEPSTAPVDEDMRKDSVGDVDGVREIVDDAPVSEDVAPVSEDGVLRPVNVDDVDEGADKVNDEDSEKGEGAIGTVPSADGKSSDLDGGDRGDTTPGGVSDSDVPKAESEPSTLLNRPLDSPVGTVALLAMQESVDDEVDDDSLSDSMMSSELSGDDDICDIDMMSTSDENTLLVEEDMRKDSVGDVDGVHESVDDASVSEDGVLRPVDVNDSDKDDVVVPAERDDGVGSSANAREAPLSSSPLDDVEYEGADKVNDEDSEKGEGAIGTVPS